MKKCLLLFAALVIVLSSSAQLELAPRLGINFCVLKGKYSNQDDYKYKWIGGPAIGITGKYDLTQDVKARLEFGYTIFGQKLQHTTDDEGNDLGDKEISTRQRYNCLQFAFMGQIAIPDALPGMFVFAGPFFTYRMGGKAKVINDNTTKTYDIKWDDAYQSGIHNDIYYINPDYNRRMDVGLYFGAGIGRNIGPGRIEADLRFGFGIRDMFKFDSRQDKKDAKENGYKSYNSKNICISLTYWGLLDELY